MNLQEAIEYINRVSFSPWRLGLERITELLEKLGNPQNALRFVHVGGSNGKGSTCAMIESILREAGYITGLFPSPYIEEFRERFQVCGEYITEEALVRITDRVRRIADAMEDHPTHFELVTAIGMLYFLEKRCDLVVLEVGLGGEFDATNVIEAPEAAVLTRIGLEHTEYLGNTLAEIARTKSGIIKTGTEVVCYENEPEVMEVVRGVCAERGCPLQIAEYGRIRLLEASLRGQVFSFLPPSEASSAGLLPEDSFLPSSETSSAGLLTEDSFRPPSQASFAGLLPEDSFPPSSEASSVDLLPEEALSAERQPQVTLQENHSAPVYRLSLIGEYQLHNAATALTVIEVLRRRGFSIPEQAVADGLAKVRWPARFEVLHHDPLFILDGGHNPQCAQALSDSIRQYLPDRKRIFLIGILADKDVEAVLTAVLPLGEEFLCVRPDSHRALEPEELAARIRARGAKAQAFSLVEDGIRTALERNRTEKGSCIVAFGSLYLAGRIRSSFAKELKRFQRRQCIGARRALRKEQRDAASRRICELLMDLPVFQTCRTLFSYAAAPDEADPARFHEWARERGIRIAYPVCGKDGRMDAMIPLSEDSWETGAYGIRSPLPERSVPVRPDEIDAVLVPCVGFDRQGGRIGHGAGYYDRYLVQCPQAEKILLAFEAQCLPEVMMEATDRKIVRIVTENGFSEPDGQLRSCQDINFTDCAGYFFDDKEENAVVPGYGEAF